MRSQRTSTLRAQALVALFVFVSLATYPAAQAQEEEPQGEPVGEAFDIPGAGTTTTKPEEKGIGEIFLESDGKTNERSNRNAFENEKQRIQNRLREKYEKRKVQQLRSRRARALRLRRLKDKNARQHYLEEKSFRRRTLLDDGLQSERLKEESMTGLLPRTAEGSARFEYRRFIGEKQEARSLEQNFSVLAEVETGGRFKNFEIKIWNLGRFDLDDNKRTGLIPYENWLGYKTDALQVKAGTQIENWAMTEVFTPSDVFNSRNIDSQFENSEKIGEPSLSVRLPLFGGYATAYYMPLFMGPIIPSEKSRLSSLPPDTKLLESRFLDAGQLKENYKPVTQYALRYTRKFGPADLAFHYVHHIDRQQAFPGQDSVYMGLRPIFLPLTQMGFNGAAVWGENIFKFDYVQRNFDAESTSLPFLVAPIGMKDHSILAFGLERPYAHENGWESTGFLEMQKILGVSKTEAEQLSLNQNDLMFGYRLSINDTKSKEVKAFLIVDLETTSEMFWSAAYSQKVLNKLKMAGGVRQVISKTDATKNIDDTDHVFVNVTYFF